MLYVLLNPVAAPAADFASGVLVFFGVVFLIAAVVSVIFFALKRADDRFRYGEQTDDEDKKENE